MFRRLLPLLFVLCLTVLGLWTYRYGTRYLTERFRDWVQPYLKTYSGLTINFDDALVRPFPLFLEIRGLHLANEAGSASLRLETLRAYVDPMALVFSREVSIDYIWGHGVLLSGDINAMTEVVKTVDGQKEITGKGLPTPNVEKWGVTLHRFMLEDIRLDLQSSSGGYAFASEPIRVTGRADPLRIELWGGTVLFRKENLDLSVPFEVSGDLRVGSGNTLEVRKLNFESEDSGIVLDGQISREGASLKVDALFSVGQLVDYLKLEGPREGALSVKGDLSIQGPVPEGISVDLGLSGDGYIEHLFAALGQAPLVSGYTEASGFLKGPYGAFEAGGHARLRDGDIIGLDDAWIETDFTFRNRSLDFMNGAGRIIGGEASQVKVGLRFEESVAYDVACHVANVDSVRLFEFIGWVPPHSPGHVSGNVRVWRGGNPSDEMSLEGQAFFVTERPGPQAFERVLAASAGFRLDKGILALQPVTLYTETSRASALARVDLYRKMVAVDFGGEGEEISEFSQYVGSHVTGPYVINGRVDGPFSNPLVAGEIRLGPGSLVKGNYDSLELVFTWMGDQLTVSHYLLQMGEGLLEGEGILRGTVPGSDDKEYRLLAEARSVPLPRLASFMGWPAELFETSRLSGKLDLNGKGSAYKANVTGSLTSGAIGGQRFDVGHFSLDIRERGIEIHSLDFERNLSILKTRGTLGFEGEYCLEFSDSEVYLSDVDLLPDGFDGMLRLQADCAFARRAGRRGLEGTGTLTLDNLSVRGARFGGGLLNFSLVDQTLSVEGDLMEGRGHVQGWMSLGPERTWFLNAKLDHNDYAPMVASALDLPEGELALTTSAELDLTYVDGVTEGHLELDGLGLEAFGARFESIAAVTAVLRDKEVRIPPFSLKSGDNYFDFEGSLRLQEDMDLRFGGKLNLSFLRGISRSVQAADGEAWVVFDISGPWRTPSLNGGIHFQDGSILLKGVPGRFREIEGTLFLEGDRFGTEGVATNWGGGRLNLAGGGTLRGTSLGDFHFDLLLEEVSLRPVEDLFLAFGGHLFFDGHAGRRYLSGELTYNKAVYRGRVDYKSWLVNLRRKQSVPPEATWVGQTEMNVHVKGSEPLVIENNIARALLETDLYLMGTVSRPRLLGRMEADQGRVFFRSHEFRIVSGSADFVNPNAINPVFNVEAETFTQGYAIRLRLDGPMDQFNMSLDSDPPLTETDILSLLTVGRIEEDLKGMEGEIGAAEAASFLSGDIQDAIESKVSAITGFDRFQLDPHVNQTVGTMGPRLTVGKRLFSDRLFVTYSSDVGTIEGQTVSLEYRLTRGVSVIGQRDETGANGADVRIHFNFD